MLEWLVGPYLPVVFSCVLFSTSLAFGAAPERILVGILAAVSASAWACGYAGTALSDPVMDFICLYIDVIALFAIVSVAMYANRLYPIGIGGAQLVKIICHFWHLKLEHSSVYVHMLVDSFVFILQLLVATVGLVFHVKRVGDLGGGYSSWSHNGRHAV